MTKQLTGIQANLLKLWKSDQTICDNDDRMVAMYWTVFDRWDSIEGNLYEKLKSMTSYDSLTRARRLLNEYSYITYSKDAQKRREEQYKEKTEEYSNTDVFAMMREKINKGEL